MLDAVISLTALGSSLGLMLGVAARRFHVEGDPLEEEIAAMMPGSQCGQCGYAGCSVAAAAIVAGEAAPTCCPPGGRALASALAEKLGLSIDLSTVEEIGPVRAHVQEALCIGCTKCFRVCPTDAIVGAVKQVHGVLHSACTGCGACEEGCPTGAIDLLPVEVTIQSWVWPRPAHA